MNLDSSIDSRSSILMDQSWQLIKTVLFQQCAVGCGEIGFNQVVIPHIREEYQFYPKHCEDFLNFCMSLGNKNIKRKAIELLEECKKKYSASALPAPPQVKVIPDATAQIQAKKAMSGAVHIKEEETKALPPISQTQPTTIEKSTWGDLTSAVKKCQDARIDHHVFKDLVVPFLNDPGHTDQVKRINLLSVCIDTKNEIVKPQVREFLKSEVSKLLVDSNDTVALDSVVQFVDQNIRNEEQFCLELIKLCKDSSMGDVKERATKLYEQYAPSRPTRTRKSAKSTVSSKPKPQAVPPKIKKIIDEEKLEADKAIAEALRAENEAKALKKAEEEKKLKAETELNNQLREIEKAKKIAEEREEEKRRADAEAKKIADAKKAKQEKLKQEADAVKQARKERKNKAKERKKNANPQSESVESQPSEIPLEVETSVALDPLAPTEIISPIKISKLNPNAQAYKPVTIEINREIVPYFIIEFLDKIERFTKRRVYLGGSMVAKLILKNQDPEYKIEYTDLDVRVENFLQDKSSSQEVLYQKMDEWSQKNEIKELRKIKGNYPSIITQVPDGEFFREFDISIWERGEGETTDEAFIKKIENECDSTYSAMLLRPTSDSDTLNVIASQKTIIAFQSRINDTVRDPNVVFSADLRCVLRWVMKEDFFANQQFQNSERVTQILSNSLMPKTWFFQNLLRSHDKDLQQKWLSTFIGNVLFKRLGIVEAIELLHIKYGILSAMTSISYSKFRSRMSCMDYYDNSDPYAKQLAFYVLVYALHCEHTRLSRENNNDRYKLHRWPFFKVIQVIEEIAKEDYDAYLKPTKDVFFNRHVSDEEFPRLLRIVPQHLLPMNKRPVENKVYPQPVPESNPSVPHYGIAPNYDPRFFYNPQSSFNFHVNVNVNVNLNVVSPQQFITSTRKTITVPRRK